MEIKREPRSPSKHQCDLFNRLRTSLKCTGAVSGPALFPPSDSSLTNTACWRLGVHLTSMPLYAAGYCVRFCVQLRMLKVTRWPLEKGSLLSECGDVLLPCLSDISIVLTPPRPPGARQASQSSKPRLSRPQRPHARPPQGAPGTKEFTRLLRAAHGLALIG